MTDDFPTFAKGEAVHHPFDSEVYGNVLSQDRGSVYVKWDNGDIDSQGCLALNLCREESDLSGCDWFRGVGTCSFGCRDEPSCQTCEPEDGWPGTRPRA